MVAQKDMKEIISNLEITLYGYGFLKRCVQLYQGAIAGDCKGQEGVERRPKVQETRSVA